MTRAIVDSAGRAVTVPARPTRVYPTGNPAWAAVWCVAPDRVAGWHAPMPSVEPSHMPKEIAELPVLERLSGQNLDFATAAVRDVRPDLIVDYGTCDPPFVATAERLQEATGVPVVMIDGHLPNTATACALLGKVLNAGERAAKLGAAFTRIWSGIAGRLPARAGPRVYYAIGGDGCRTVRRDSIHVESLAMLGAINVAEVPSGPGGRVRVSIDDIGRWNPDLVITIDAAFHNAARGLPGWSDLPAVRAGRIHLAPSAFLSWFDYPPSLNRVIGLPWLATQFYPDIFTDDLADEVRAFYDLFYGITLNEAEARHLLNDAA
ncbi:MAG: iron ABC transporter substrate-binding protein [Chloroflexi bacterium]|nr:iron ABC transporter substrate-binding protein [Chloroflexota bacterium]